MASTAVIPASLGRSGRILRASRVRPGDVCIAPVRRLEDSGADRSESNLTVPRFFPLDSSLTRADTDSEKVGWWQHCCVWQPQQQAYPACPHICPQA
ncbi:MAG: hypothetical protein ACPIOQ_44365, partial [Promethearchaeia archaeon]